MPRPVILVVTADPGGILGGAWPGNAGRLALDQELDGILRGVALAPFHDFELISVRAVTVSELVQLLQKFNPTMLYFAGHGVSARRAPGQSSAATRDIKPVTSGHDGGIILLDDRGRPCLLTAATLALIIPTAAPALRILVLNACHSAEQAEIMRHVVDCVIAMHGPIRDEVARSFAFVLFCALVNRQSIGRRGRDLVRDRAAPARWLPTGGRCA